MSVTIDIIYGTSIRDNLVDDWRQTVYYRAGDWKGYLRSLPGVIDVSYPHNVEFNSEADKTWFILRWS